jgi:hypothetical protein
MIGQLLQISGKPKQELKPWGFAKIARTSTTE